MPELSLPTAQPSSAHSVTKKRKTDGRRWQQSRTYQCLPAPRSPLFTTQTDARPRRRLLGLLL